MTKLALLVLGLILVDVASSYILVPPPRRRPPSKRLAEILYGGGSQNDEWPFEGNQNVPGRQQQLILIELPSEEGELDVGDGSSMIKRQRPITRFG